jgi:hypothetical protein
VKVGDLIRLPQNEGYAIAMKVVTHDQDPKMPIGGADVMVIQEWGPDWWDADACMVINESR